MIILHTHDEDQAQEIWGFQSTGLPLAILAGIFHSS